MLRLLLQALIFILAIVATLEICLRFVYFGTDAFNVRAINSHTLLIDSDLVQPSEYLDIYYELKPGLESVFRNKAFVTNSHGLADKEYSLKKPANVFRIAVVGSSWSMATGVEVDNTYQSLLEEKLQRELQGKLSDMTVEIINFAVEYYGFREIIGTVKHKALAYNPDMIIFASTAITPAILWDEQHTEFTKTETTPPFWQSYLFSSTMNLIGKDGYKKSRRKMVDPVRGAYSRQIRHSIDELASLTYEKNIAVAVLWLTYDKTDETMVQVASKHAKSKDFFFTHINLIEEAKNKNISETILYNRNDNHPNEIGHKLIADKLYRELWENGEIRFQPQNIM